MEGKDILIIFISVVFGYIINLTTPLLKSYIDKGSLSLRSRSIEIVKEDYQRYKQYRENHATLAVEILRQLIQKEFNVSYHPNYLNRLLRSIGFSPQRPLPQAIEQERELVEAWLEQDWSRIKKVAATRRRNRVLG